MRCACSTGRFECIGVVFLGSRLQINEEKSHAQKITRKTNPVITTYMMNGISLQSTFNERDLGVLVSSDFRWKEHVLEQTASAKKYEKCWFYIDKKINIPFNSLFTNGLCYAGLGASIN